MQRCSRRRRGRDNDHHATARTRLRATTRRDTSERIPTSSLSSRYCALLLPTNHAPTPLRCIKTKPASPFHQPNPKTQTKRATPQLSPAPPATHQPNAKHRGREVVDLVVVVDGGGGVPDTVHEGNTVALGEAQVPAAGGGERRREDEGDAAAGRRAPRRCGVGAAAAAAAPRPRARGEGVAVVPGAAAGADPRRVRGRHARRVEEGVGHVAAERARGAVAQARAAPEAAPGGAARPAHRLRAEARRRDIQVHRRLQGAHHHAPPLHRAPAAAAQQGGAGVQWPAASQLACCLYPPSTWKLNRESSCKFVCSIAAHVDDYYYCCFFLVICKKY